VMVGAFQFFFFQQGVYAESVLTIWMHGAFEISAIIIAGAAGLTLGRGLVFPGTFTRLKAFRISAQRGIKIMVGTIPLFLIAGFIEGFITRHTEMPNVFRGFFILLCLAYVVGYFVILPVRLARKGVSLTLNDAPLPPDQPSEIDFYVIKERPTLLTDTLIFYRRHFGFLSRMALGCALYFMGYVFWAGNLPVGELFFFDSFFLSALRNLRQFFVNENIPLLFILNTQIFSVLIYISYRLIIRSEAAATGTPVAKTALQNMLDFLKTAIVTILLGQMLRFGSGLSVIFIFMIFPSFFLWIFVMQKEGISLFAGIERTFTLISGSLLKMTGIFSLLGLLSAVGMMLMDTPIVWSLLQTIVMNFPVEEGNMVPLTRILLAFVNLFILYSETILFLVITGIT
ncbi:MAG: stage II sporulation protein M, partial [Bacteroidetes bacterium]